MQVASRGYVIRFLTSVVNVNMHKVNSSGIIMTFVFILGGLLGSDSVVTDGLNNDQYYSHDIVQSPSIHKHLTAEYKMKNGRKVSFLDENSFFSLTH